MESLTTLTSVVIDSNVQVMPIMCERISLDENSFAELVVWKLSERPAGSSHDFKYRLALVSNNACVMRYDNEAGKGDHKHAGEVETDYAFSDLDRLQADFWADVEQWRTR